MRLPLCREAHQPEQPASSVTAAAPGDASPALRLLLVDDSVDAAMLLAMVLESDGFDVKVAHEARHALEIAADFNPEIVLLDLGLPGMDGLQLAREMRKEASTANALLIAVTGYGQAADRQRSQEAGFDFHLVKPVSADEIQRVVASRFPREEH